MPPSRHLLILKDLEALQSSIGNVQTRLLEELNQSSPDPIQENLQKVLIQLEGIQRNIGEIQIQLFKLWPELSKSEKAISESAEMENSSQDIIHPPPGTPSDELHCVNPRDWLNSHNIQIMGIQPSSGLDAAADKAAFTLGLHFDRLRQFYNAIKKSLNEAGTKRFQFKDEPQDIISLVVQFGKTLHKSAFLESFVYLKRKKQIVFTPLTDGRVINFFTGGWLERYVMVLIRNWLKQFLKNWDVNYQVGCLLYWISDNTKSGQDSPTSSRQFSLSAGKAACCQALSCGTGFQPVIFQAGRMPAPQTSWPVNYQAGKDACSTDRKGKNP